MYLIVFLLHTVLSMHSIGTVDSLSVHNQFNLLNLKMLLHNKDCTPYYQVLFTRTSRWF